MLCIIIRQLWIIQPWPLCNAIMMWWWFNPFCPAPDSESPCTWLRVRHRNLFHQTGFRSLETMHTSTKVTTPTFFTYSHMPCLEQISLNFFVFYKFLQHHEQVLMLHTQGGFSWDVCWWGQWFDPDVAESLSNPREQVCKTGQQDSVEMTVFRLLQCWKYSSDTWNIPFFNLHRLLKDSEWIICIDSRAQCCLFICNNVYAIWWLCLM